MNRVRTSLRLGTALSLVIVASGLASADPYRVGPGDTLAIVAYGNPALSGNFSVDDNGTIGYPVIGHIAVAGKTTPEIGDALTAALVTHIAGTTATASVSAYAPVFVLGDVTTPGSYQFRPGMIALELLALSGGQRRSADTTQNVGLQFIATRQQYDELQLQSFSLEVKRQRVIAEREGTLLTMTGKPGADLPAVGVQQGIIDAERNILAVQARTAKAEDDGLAAQEQSFIAEIASITQGIALQAEEIRSLEADLGTSMGLVAKGLATESSQRALERLLSATRRDALDLASAKARAEQQLLDVQLRRTVLQNSRQNTAAETLRDIAVQLNSNSAAMRSLDATITQLAAMDATAFSNANRTAVLEMSITRLINGQRKTLAADQLTEIRPGDILQTRVIANPPPPSTALAVR